MIKKPSYCPDWFDIEAYNVCADFGRTEWIFAIHERLNMPHHVSTDIEEYFQLRLATLKEYLPEDAATKQASDEWAEAVRQSDIESAVRDADLSDLIWRLNELCKTMPDARNVIIDGIDYLDLPDELEIKVSRLNALEQTLGSNPKSSLYEILHSKLPYCDTLGGGWGAALLDVDLFSPDEVLKEAFEQWLKAKREELGQADLSKPLYAEGNFAEWSKLRVLAYIDLLDWCSETGTKLTNAQMGNLLYPDEYEIDLAERVRKTLPKKATEILHAGRRLAGY